MNSLGLLHELIEWNARPLAQPGSERKRWVVTAPFDLRKVRRRNINLTGQHGQRGFSSFPPFTEGMHVHAHL